MIHVEKPILLQSHLIQLLSPLVTSPIRRGRFRPPLPSTPTSRTLHQQHHRRAQPIVAEDDISRLAARPLHPLALVDLVKHGHPPLSTPALLSSANFTLSLLPIRLAHRLNALRNLPFIVVSNPHIARIYANYQHSLSTLLPYFNKGPNPITSLAEESNFTEVLADLVHTHANTIHVLARGFLECRKYISPLEVTRFLDEHLRARIGTRLIAEQHIALHCSSLSAQAPNTPYPSSYIGVIDTALLPASIVSSCGAFVADICELKYGVRPSLIIDGQPDTRFAHVPVHLEYILTELLKNAFRATVESGMEREPVVITIAAAPDDSAIKPASQQGDAASMIDRVSSSSSPASSASSAPGVTIRIRDRGGGIAPEHLPNIWSYSFTTFSDDDLPGANSGNMDALNAISSGAGVGGSSSIAGLGYGLPLGRAYAEYFGGGIAVQSIWGWGTDVYLSLRGVGKAR